MRIYLNTDSKPIIPRYSKLRTHPELGVEMANLELEIGNAEINISFDSSREMIDFCKKHNFEYQDDREQTNGN